MSTQHDHDEEDCPLCGGVGEVSISKYGSYEGTDYYGCPMCISRERDEEARLIESQRDELLAVNAGLAQAARHLLEAVEDFEGYRQDIATAIADLRDALDAAPQPAAVEQGPVGFMNAGHLCELESRRIPYVYVYPNQGTGAEVPIYTTPQPARQPPSALPDGDIVFFSDRGDAVSGYSAQRVLEILRANGIWG